MATGEFSVIFISLVLGDSSEEGKVCLDSCTCAAYFRINFFAPIIKYCQVYYFVH